MPVIDLTRPIPPVVERSHMVHVTEFDRVMRLIENRITSIHDIHPGKEPDYFPDHDVITITGTRGGGKTTFLRSILEVLKNKNEARLVVLKIIDPTLIEEKGHIFLTLIAIIKEQVSLAMDNEDASKKMEWDKVWRKLAGGLPTIDGVGKALVEADWQDPEYTMDIGIRSVSSAWHLANYFRTFINEALKKLGNKHAFVVAFDDIDVDFRKGILVLEMIRKYFAGTRIVTIISGDMKLYSLGVRKYKWENFGKALLINEGEKMGKMPYYNDLITELESQYLLKVLKTEGRVHLKSLYEKVRLDGQKDIWVLGQTNNEVILIETAYKGIMDKFGIRNTYQQDVYISFLLGLPIRSQVQLLRVLYQSPDQIADPNILAPFFSDLIEKSVDTSVLESNAYMFNILTLKLLMKAKDVSDLYQLQPLTADASMNGCLMGLTLLARERYQEKPYLIFDYFIRLGLVKNLVTALPHVRDENGEYSMRSPSIEGLIRHTGMYQDKILRDMMGNLNAYLCGAFSEREPRFGMISSLQAFAKSRKQRAEITANRFDAVFSDVHGILSTLAYIPLTISKSGVDKGTICYSFYTLLATIGELIRKSDAGDLSRGVLELSQPRTFMMPDFSNDRSVPGGTDYFQEDSTDTDSQGLDQFIFAFEEWIKTFGNITVSPHLLGKISTRFYYSLQSIESNEKFDMLGDMMHLRIVAFLNAVLIEEAREHFENLKGFTLNNPSTQDFIFERNLSVLLPRKDGRSTVFFKWVASCPLLMIYLNPKSQAYFLLSNYLNVDKVAKLLNENFSLFPYLNKIPASERAQKASSVSKHSKRSTEKNARISYAAIAQAVKENRLPYEWFQEPKSMKEARELNNILRERLATIFPSEEWPSLRLRNLRNFIVNSKIRW